MHENKRLLPSNLKDCGCKAHETDPEGIVSNMNPVHSQQSYFRKITFNPLNAELNPICHLLALLGAHHILHVSGIRVEVELHVR